MTKLMGILNVTPDSFSDGGQHFDVDAALEAGLQMARDGADFVDVGGESTRPGAEPVSVAEELRRVLPVIGYLTSKGVGVSVDTSKPWVAHEAIEAGAGIVNDVTALRDPEMRAYCAHARVTVCLMHMKGEPRTMQAAPVYEDVVEEVRRFLLEAALRAEAAGIASDKIWLDPGIGFGKTIEHNLLLLRHLDRIVSLGYPVLVGISRKSFLGRIASPAAPLPVYQRLSASLAAQTLAQSRGAAILRVHDVKEAKQAATTAAAILGE